MSLRLEMRKFMPTHWNRNTHIIVTDYNWAFKDKLKGQALVIYVQDLSAINNIINDIKEPTKINAIVYENPYTSLETEDIDPNWGNTPIIMKINRLGAFRNVSDKIELIKRLNITFIFTANNHQSAIDAQILASLGIHSGIALSAETTNWEELTDLMTYTFYGTMPHAAIEPFSTIEQYYCGTNYVSPLFAEFENPDRYIHVDAEGNLAFSREELKNKQYFDSGWDKLYNISAHPAITERKHRWQEMFIETHPCTFCPAYRICDGYFKELPDKSMCQKTMNELLEGIEFYKKNRCNQKESCQL